MTTPDWLKKRKNNFIAGLALVVLVYFQIAYLFLSIAAFQPRIALNTVQMIRVVLSRDVIGAPELALVINSFGPLIGFLLLAAVVKKAHGGRQWIKVFALLVTVIYGVNAVMLAAKVVTGEALDSFLLWHNLGDSYRTLSIFVKEDKFLFALGLSVIVLYYRGLLRLVGLVAERNDPRLKSSWGTGFWGLAGFCLLPVVYGQVYGGNGFFRLLLDVRQPESAVRTLYQRYFQDSVERNGRITFQPAVKSPGENLFVFQLESLNADLVNESITPRLVEAAAQGGIFFPRIQAGSVLTILSMETILCSTLPTLGENLAQSEKLWSRLACLPAMMKQLGYRTLYFQNYPDLRFHNMQSFFKAIGFDELHSSDIMEPDDKRLAWGYSEDIFYRRVFAYLRSLRNTKIFAYVLVGATNHYPFYGDETKRVYPEHTGSVPFPSAANVKERTANTTYLQDLFFGQMYREEFMKDYSVNSHAIVLGDHSTPLEEHPGNKFFLSGAYQENFVTSMAVLPAKNEASRRSYAVGKRVQALYSYLDILPTILDLYGIRVRGYYGTSFLGELKTGSQKTNTRCVVSVQPFSGGAISTIKYPIKRVYNFRRGNVREYDLTADSLEVGATKESQIDETATGILDSCLRSLREDNGRSEQ